MRKLFKKYSEWPLPHHADRFFAKIFVQDASYLRLREIGLYYTFQNWHKCCKGNNVGISFNNYITITKYKSYDPEVSNFGTGFSTGVDVDPYPATKQAEFHVTFNF